MSSPSDNPSSLPVQGCLQAIPEPKPVTVASLIAHNNDVAKQQKHLQDMITRALLHSTIEVHEGYNSDYRWLELPDNVGLGQNFHAEICEIILKNFPGIEKYALDKEDWYEFDKSKRGDIKDSDTEK